MCPSNLERHRHAKNVWDIRAAPLLLLLALCYAQEDQSNKGAQLDSTLSSIELTWSCRGSATCSKGVDRTVEVVKFNPEDRTGPGFVVVDVPTAELTRAQESISGLEQPQDFELCFKITPVQTSGSALHAATKAAVTAACMWQDGSKALFHWQQSPSASPMVSKVFMPSETGLCQQLCIPLGTGSSGESTHTWVGASSLARSIQGSSPLLCGRTGQMQLFFRTDFNTGGNLLHIGKPSIRVARSLPDHRAALPVSQPSSVPDVHHQSVPDASGADYTTNSLHLMHDGPSYLSSKMSAQPSLEPKLGSDDKRVSNCFHIPGLVTIGSHHTGLWSAMLAIPGEHLGAILIKYTPADDTTEMIPVNSDTSLQFSPSVDQNDGILRITSHRVQGGNSQVLLPLRTSVLGVMDHGAEGSLIAAIMGHIENTHNRGAALLDWLSRAEVESHLRKRADFKGMIWQQRGSAVCSHSPAAHALHRQFVAYISNLETMADTADHLAAPEHFTTVKDIVHARCSKDGEIHAALFSVPEARVPFALALTNSFLWRVVATKTHGSPQVKKVKLSSIVSVTQTHDKATVLASPASGRNFRANRAKTKGHQLFVQLDMHDLHYEEAEGFFTKLSSSLESLKPQRLPQMSPAEFVRDNSLTVSHLRALHQNNGHGVNSESAIQMMHECGSQGNTRSPQKLSDDVTVVAASIDVLLKKEATQHAVHCRLQALAADCADGRVICEGQEALQVPFECLNTIHARTSSTPNLSRKAKQNGCPWSFGVLDNDNLIDSPGCTSSLDEDIPSTIISGWRFVLDGLAKICPSSRVSPSDSGSPDFLKASGEAAEQHIHASRQANQRFMTRTLMAAGYNEETFQQPLSHPSLIPNSSNQSNSTQPAHQSGQPAVPFADGSSAEILAENAIVDNAVDSVGASEFSSAISGQPPAECVFAHLQYNNVPSALYVGCGPSECAGIDEHYFVLCNATESTTFPLETLCGIRSEARGLMLRFRQQHLADGKVLDEHDGLDPNSTEVHVHLQAPSIPAIVQRQLAQSLSENLPIGVEAENEHAEEGQIDSNQWTGTNQNAMLDAVQARSPGGSIVWHTDSEALVIIGDELEKWQLPSPLDSLTSSDPDFTVGDGSLGWQLSSSLPLCQIAPAVQIDESTLLLPNRSHLISTSVQSILSELTAGNGVNNNLATKCNATAMKIAVRRGWAALHSAAQATGVGSTLTDSHKGLFVRVNLNHSDETAGSYSGSESATSSMNLEAAAQAVLSAIRDANCDDSTERNASVLDILQQTLLDALQGCQGSGSPSTGNSRPKPTRDPDWLRAVRSLGRFSATKCVGEAHKIGYSAVCCDAFVPLVSAQNGTLDARPFGLKACAGNHGSMLLAGKTRLTTVQPSHTATHSYGTQHDEQLPSTLMLVCTAPYSALRSVSTTDRGDMVLHVAGQGAIPVPIDVCGDHEEAEVLLAASSQL